MDPKKIMQALDNCLDTPKCKDCPWEACEGFQRHVEMPITLLMAIRNLLVEQEKQIWMLAGMYPDAEDQPCPPPPQPDLCAEALQALVNMESEIPCDAMVGTDNWCEENCIDKSCPAAECWVHYLMGGWKNGEPSTEKGYGKEPE